MSSQNSTPAEQSSFHNLEISSSRKRKWERRDDDEDDRSKASKSPSKGGESGEPTVDIGLHLQTPLPSEWQQCLDLQSGQIHFYNTQTRKRTNKDPRQEADVHRPMSLDLELNLPSQSPDHTEDADRREPPIDQCNWTKSSSERMLSPEFISSAGAEENREMVAAVCMRCHMLVMLCKSSPVCPNCKFMHPLSQRPLSPCKPSLSLLCCKD